MDDKYIEFPNGSKITIVDAKENTRGKIRGYIIGVDLAKGKDKTLKSDKSSDYKE